MSDEMRRLIAIIEGETKDLPPGVYLTVSRSFEQPDDDDDDWDEDAEPEEDGTFVMAYTTADKDVNGNDLCIAHLHVPDENVRQSSWFAGDVSVSPEFQRMGIATAMYRRMAEVLELPARASSIQSPDGQALWRSGKIA